jgi:hypothetical protein
MIFNKNSFYLQTSFRNKTLPRNNKVILQLQKNLKHARHKSKFKDKEFVKIILKKK